MNVKRFTLRITDEPQSILLPPRAEVLTARVEGSLLAVYVLMGFVQPEAAREFLVVPTDAYFSAVPERLPFRWLATVTHKSQPYHVFEAQT